MTHAHEHEHARRNEQAGGMMEGMRKRKTLMRLHVHRRVVVRVWLPQPQHLLLPMLQQLLWVTMLLLWLWM